MGATGTGGDETPTENFEGQTLDAYDLFADIDQTPGVIDYSEEQRLSEHLNAFFGRDLIWEVQRNNGTTSIEATEPDEGRVADGTPAVTDLSVNKRQEIIHRVIIKGSNRQTTSEPFTITETFEPLNNDAIVPNSESVYDPDTGTEYDRDDDYEISWRDGEIRLSSGSSISSGTALEIDYASEIEGRAEVDNVPADPNEAVETFSSLNSVRACEQVAQTLLNDFSVPRWEAQAVIPPQTRLFSGIAAINFELADRLPDDALPLSPRTIQRTPAGLQLQLGDIDTFSSRASELRNQVNAVARRV
jgi:hypothetical protein